MIPEYGFPLKRKRGFLRIGTPVSNLRNWGVKPPGILTHLAMAFGRECCLKGYKTYFLRASELNQKLTDARKHGREEAVINGLAKPSCLIIDEIGRCVFDKENTRMFFDVIDRRYNKRWSQHHDFYQQ